MQLPDARRIAQRLPMGIEKENTMNRIETLIGRRELQTRKRFRRMVSTDLPDRLPCGLTQKQEKSNEQHHPPRDAVPVS
jgi:hypothetical protein